MKSKSNSEIKTTLNGQPPANEYDDGNIPKTDLPQDIKPDDVPRKDGPGEESSE